MYTNKLYITSAVLVDIQEQVVEDLKTAFNVTNQQTEISSSAIEIPPIYPDTEPTIIDVPIFSAIDVKDFPYVHVDEYSASPGTELSATSALPGPATMIAVDDNGDDITLENLSVTECMINATANGIIKQLIEDNKLVYNPTQDKTFKWFVQEETSTVSFDISADYPYWNQGGLLDKETETVLIYPPSILSATSQVLTSNTELGTTLTKVSDADGNFYPLEKWHTESIDTENVEVSNITSINIFAKNSSDGEKRNVKDFYIDGNNIVMKLQHYYLSSTFDNIEFDITIQYFFN